MQVSWRSLIALALLPFAFMTIAHAQDANDPTVYMVTYLDVTPASRARRCSVAAPARGGQPQGSRHGSL